MKSIKTKLDLDNMALSWVNKWIDIASKVYKKKTVKGNRSIGWWTIELKIQRNRINALYKKYRRTKNADDKIIYNKERALYKKNILEAKLKSWRAYCTNTRKHYGNTYKITANKFSNVTDFIHTAFDTSSIMDDYEQINRQLLRHHFKASDMVISQDKIEQMVEELVYNKSEIPDIKIKEIDLAFKTLNSKKAPGPDNLDHRIIQNIYKSIPKLFKKILEFIVNKWGVP